MPPKVAVILLNWNNLSDTLQCLEQLQRLDYPQACLEIIIIDNGSNDDSATALAQLSGITFIPSETNLGFAAGSNLGLRHFLAGDAPYALFLNNDTLLPPDFLGILVDWLESHPDCGIVAPKMNFASDHQKIWAAGGKFHRPRILGSLAGLGEPDQGQWDQPRPVDFVPGTCLLLRRSLLQSIGLLDDRFFFYHEDVDFCLRARQAGYSIDYQPASVIYHQVSLSTQNDIPQRLLLQNQARMVFFFKHIHGVPVFWVFILELLRATRSTLTFLFHRQKPLAKATLKGIALGVKAGWNNRLRDQPLLPPEEIERRRKRRSRAKYLITLLFLGAVLTYLGLRGFSGVQQLVQSGIQLRPQFLLYSFLCQLTGVTIAAWLWGDILRQLGISSPFYFDLIAFCVSALARKIPGLVAYAVSRIVLYSEIRASKVKVSLAMVIEMLMMALSGLVIVLLVAGNAVLPSIFIQYRWIWMGISLALSLAICLFSPRLVQSFLRFRQKHAPADSPQEVNVSLSFFSCLRWLVGEGLVILLAGGVGYFLIKSVNWPQAVPYTSILSAFSFSVSLAPLAVWLPGDIGLRDSIMYLAITPWITASMAALMTLAYRIWLSLLEISFGLAASLAHQLLKKKVQP